MKRAAGFMALAAGALVALVLLVAWYLLSYQPSGGSLGGVMGQMMGAGGTSGMTLVMPGWVWGGIVVLVALLGAGLVGLGYYLAYPEITPAPLLQQPTQGPEPVRSSEMSWAVLMRTSKAEEKRVLEVLAAHDGSYLQKFVVKEAGLSKLKTHRIVSRLAERGVVSVERSGNTNQVSLAPWVRGDAMKSAPAA